MAKAVRKARHHLKPVELCAVFWLWTIPSGAGFAVAITNLSAIGVWNLVSINNPEETIQTIRIDPYMSLTWHGNNKLGNVKDLRPFFEKLGGRKPATFATLEGNPVPMCALLVWSQGFNTYRRDSTNPDYIISGANNHGSAKCSPKIGRTHACPFTWSYKSCGLLL